MKSLSSVILTFVLAIATLSAVVYSSCKKDKCDKVICLNLGTCDGGNCICPTGYEGIRCEVLMRDKLVANYNGNDSCGITGEAQYPIHFLAVLDKPRELMMKNLLNDPDDSAIATMQATDSFTFIGANNSTTFRGTGTMRHDSLHLAYHVEHDTTSYDCFYFGQSRR